MALVFPVAAREQLVGSAVLLAQHGNHLLFSTALHIIGEFDDIRIAVPPHQGNCAVPQTYPIFQTPALAAHVVASNAFADMVIVAAEAQTGPNTPLPRIATAPGQIAVGSDIIVLGYPFAPVGSFLETWTPGCVVALARRQVLEGVSVDELVLSIQDQPGLAGAAVIGRQDGVVHGILRRRRPRHAAGAAAALSGDASPGSRRRRDGARYASARQSASKAPRFEAQA